jgi:ribonucleoside-diphosphate reductase alpha chain
VEKAVGRNGNGNGNGNGHAKPRASRSGGRRARPAAKAADPGQGITIPRRWTTAGKDPLEQVAWDLRAALISGEKGEVVFEQKDVEVPVFWSQLATNVVASKYFRGPLEDPSREHSVKQLIGRVAYTIAGWGREQSYFATEEDAQAFQDELVHLLVTQKASFNSPVWFNCGIEPHPQCSACFINSVEDNMESILKLAATEARLFKGGSGTGSNLSAIRGSMEQLKGGGQASGPVSFMRGYDAFAGVIKSGGKTRRAAKMVILNVDHPDIVEFIKCKGEEEKKAWALIDAGYDGGFNVVGGAYSSIFFQNANHSVRVTDDFMQAVESGGQWETKAVLGGRTVDTHPARDLMNMIAEYTHICGDPGLQFDTTINDWHTCPNTAPINASNPCSEYMFLDDSACNLASLNLLKFRTPQGQFDPAAFEHACHVVFLAQEIIVDNASYPTPAIEVNSHAFRPLGLGFANLGALLMAAGVPYDSDAGRAYAAAVTALMCGSAYRMSARVAAGKGPFSGYTVNAEPFLRVMNKHRDAIEGIDASAVPARLLSSARKAWDEAIALGTEHGFRNAQSTVLAPTGTIGFMMDCDTTGVEPDIALVKYKKLVGGGVMKIVNQTVPEALEKLGYDSEEVSEIVSFIDEKDTIEGAPYLKEEDLPVFDCAFRPMNGARSIEPMGHIRMMAAVQPFLSGAISKTVNVPSDASVEDIAQCYLDAWKLGLKAVAIYRDGSKRTQPLNTSLKGEKAVEGRPIRRRLPDERHALTHKFSIAGHEGYITVGLYEDGQPGEVFLVMSKEGTVISGLMDSFATAVSLALQYGVPVKELVSKFSHVRFEPAGFTGNPDIPIAKSIVDYIFRWMGLKFLPREEQPVQAAALMNGAADSGGADGHIITRAEERKVFQLQADAPPCAECGMLMVRNGACYKCLNCGSTLGCS